MSQLPPDFVTALEKAGLATFFAECTPAHQREYLRWITEAKRPETRAARIAQATQMLAEKKAKEAAKTKR